MLRILVLLLALAFLAACAARPAQEPNPESCYTLVLTCDGERLPPILVSDHWTDLRPPNLWMICWKRCDKGTRGCVSTDNCSWEIR